MLETEHLVVSMRNEMKKNKLIVYCNCCGCRLREKKAHLDIDGYYYCTPCFRKLLLAKYPDGDLKQLYKPSKPERKYRKKRRRR